MTPLGSSMHKPQKEQPHNNRNRILTRLMRRWLLHTLIGLLLFVQTWPSAIGWKRFAIDVAMGALAAPLVIPWLCELLANVSPTLEESLYRNLLLMIALRFVGVATLLGSTAAVRQQQVYIPIPNRDCVCPNTPIE